MTENRFRIVITGASGFIGTHMVSYFLNQGHSVFPIQRRPTSYPAGVEAHTCDVSDEPALTEILEKIRPDFIIHLASRAIPGRDIRKEEFDVYYRDTISPALSVARTAPLSTRLALFFGSTEEYGNSENAPFREDQSPIAFSPYGWAKISAFHGVSMIARHRGLKFAWARPFLTFGPGQSSAAVIPSLIQGCMKNKKIPLTPGDQTRDFIYIKDLCAMVGQILAQPEKIEGGTLNLCSGQPVSVRNVGEMIRKLVGKGQLAFGELPYRSNESMSHFGSTKKYLALYGEAPHTPIEQALSETVESLQ